MREGDIVVSTVRTYLEAIAVVTHEFSDCVFSTGFAVLRPKRKEDATAIYLSIKSSKTMSKIIQESKGVAYSAITLAELMRIKTVVPKNIGLVLDKLEAINQMIASVELQLLKLKEYRSALINDAVN